MGQLLGKFIANDTIKSQNILLENNTAIRAKDTLASPNELVKLNSLDQGSLGDFATPIQFVYPATVGGSELKEVVNVEYLQTAPSYITHYDITQTNTFSTSGSVYTPVVDPITLIPFSYTPSISGKYAIWFNADVRVTVNNDLLYTSMFINGVQVLDSERICHGVANNWEGIASSMAIVNIPSAQTLDLRIRSQGSHNVSLLARQMLFMWLSP